MKFLDISIKQTTFKRSRHQYSLIDRCPNIFAIVYAVARRFVILYGENSTCHEVPHFILEFVRAFRHLLSHLGQGCVGRSAVVAMILRLHSAAVARVSG